LILGIAMNTSPEFSSNADVTTNAFEQIKSLVHVESKEESKEESAGVRSLLNCC